MTAGLALPFAGEDVVRRLAADLEEPDWLLDERLDAFRRYSELPAETNPLYTTYLDLRAARFGEIEPYAVIRDAAQVSSALPEGAAGVIAVDEDGIVARGLSEEARSAGVVIDTFANVLRDRPALLRGALAGVVTLPENDKFAQFARAHSAVGVVVHVPAGVVLRQPIVVRWSVGAPGRGVVARTLVDLGANAQASILEEQVPARSHADADERQSLWWGTTEVRLAEGAVLDFAGQQDFDPTTVVIANRHAALERDARLRWALASVGGQLQKSRIDNVLAGRGSSVRQAEIAFGGGRQLFDLTTYTRHAAEDTTGDILSKGVFLDQAKGFFKGMIQIEKGARGTDSFLGEFGMNLSRRARAVAIPSLEIDQPDVRRASHSSSVGPIDETQVFYLQSRGLPRDLARKFIVMGFLEPVVARIPLPEAQDRLRELLEEKWPAAVADAAAA